MIETTITKIQYDADGVQRRWSIPFPYADVKHISIYTKVGEEPTVKVVDNYEIDEDDEVVIYPTEASEMEPLAAGTKITIARETPETQLEDSSQIHFTSQDVERGLDKLTMITQELSTTSGETMEVSAAAFEAAEEAVNTANEANTTANEAKTLAEQAVSTANDANTTANAANTKADNAVKTANDSDEKSTAAVSTANAAKTIADEANSTANEANTTATEAKAIAQEANTTANNADKTATDADKKADNAVTVANAAKDIAEGIDAKATEALEKSGNAVNTANSAKETADGIDAKATQALTDSADALSKATEAKNTADSYQGQITTLRNDVDDLGDQVAAIESKIPAEATAANQLADKAFVTEKTDELAADIAALDADKQDKITDLDAIRAGAAKGATALQSYTETDPTVPSYVKAITQDNISAWNAKQPAGDYATKEELATKQDKGDYATKTALTTGLNSKQNTLTTAQLNAVNSGITSAKVTSYDEYATTKQDKLTAGTNITISANNVISATGGGGDDGIKGDYCTSYGILEAPNGILTNPSGMQVTLKQGVVLQLAGQDIKTTVSGDMTQTLTSTADCDLFYVSGTTSLMEVAQIVWSKNEPDNGQTGVLAWWNPDNKKWKFKSNDTGNVWAEAVATPVAHIHTDGTTITRIDHIGYRVMDDEIYALKSDVAVALKERADKQLTNTNMLTNCILSAPNGVVQVSSTNPYTLIVNKGLKVALANGYNADGTPKSEIVTLENDASFTNSSTTNYNWPIRILLARSYADGSYRVLIPSNIDFAVVDTVPENIQTDKYKVFYNRKENLYYEHRTDGSLYTYKAALLGYGYLVGSKFTSIVPYKPIQLSLEGFGDYVVESQVNSDGSWYRKYKSGWLEQGGLVASTSGALGTVQTLLKAFSNVNYTLTATARGTFDKTFLITSKTATTFSCAYSSSAVGAYDWRAEGQGAN